MRKTTENYPEKVRSSKEISIAQLNIRKRAKNIDLKAAQQIVNDVIVKRPSIIIKNNAKGKI